MTQDTLLQQFSRRFGAGPTLVARAPGRVNLLGEHTDYNDGFVLPASIDRDAMCALRQNDLGRYRIVAADLGEEVDLLAADLAPDQRQWPNYALGVVAALRERGHAVPGFDCVVTSAVPRGVGLSSSAAITCALALGLDSLFGYGLDRWALAEVGQAAENGFVGASTGILDQFASLFGEVGTALLLDCRHRTFQRHAIRLPGHELLLLDTGVRHNHLTGGYGSRRADCERAVAQLQAAGWSGQNLRDLDPAALTRFGESLDRKARWRAGYVVGENARTLRAAEQLSAGDVAGFGESLLAGHWGLSERFEASCPESDAVVRFAEEFAGAKGARQMGGGFGGCVLAVVESGQVDDFVDELQQAYFESFGIGLEALDVQIGPGAAVAFAVDAAGLRQRTAEAEAAAPDLLSTAPHRRLNVLTGEWVLVSPHRAQRPWQGQVEDSPAEDLPGYVPECYLCPGNERAGGERNPTYESTYAFTNDFAALRPGHGGRTSTEGLLVAESEVGICRVLCFSPDHAKTLARMSVAEIEPVVELWREEYAALGALDFVNHVQIFENKGAMMGCSNPHPHGQIWAQQTIPDLVLRKGLSQRAYADGHGGESLLSAYLEQEVAADVRTVYVDERFVALVPWWAEWPFEVLLAPRRPMPHVGELDAAEVTAFAKTLHEVTRRYDLLFGVSFPYSAGIHQAPTDGDNHDHWHWHMGFKPPLLRSATVRKHVVGYELFGMPQRDITPEVAAERLRAL